MKKNNCLPSGFQTKWRPSTVPRIFNFKLTIWILFKVEEPIQGAKGGFPIHGGKGVTPRKVRCGVQPTSQYLEFFLPYLWPDQNYFPCPIYDHSGWHSCPKHKLWRAFVVCLIDNDEKVASSKNLSQFKTRVQKNIPNLKPKWPKSMPYLWPKRWKNQTLWGCT